MTYKSIERVVQERLEGTLTEIQAKFGSPRLTVELIPPNVWGVNLWNILPKAQWNRIRRTAYATANYRCEICGGVGPRHPVECHERWRFDFPKSRQQLVGVIALCPLCHQVKHIARTTALGYGEAARKHLARINAWSVLQVKEYLGLQQDLWMDRVIFDWSVDLAWLREVGIGPPVAPKAECEKI